MSGLDKMKSQILDEAAHTAEEKIAEAEAKAEKILKDARAEAALQAGKISDKAQADAEHYAPVSYTHLQAIQTQDEARILSAVQGDSQAENQEDSQGAVQESNQENNGEQGQ